MGAQERKKQGWSEVIVTPHDPEARFATKRSTSWTGFKLHLTETAFEDAPCIFTDVALVAAASYDGSALAPIQERLKTRDLLPTPQLVDAGYTGGDLAGEPERQSGLVGARPFQYLWCPSQGLWLLL